MALIGFMALRRMFHFERVVVLAVVAVVLYTMVSGSGFARVGDRTYTVHHGDTLYQIAVTHYDGDAREAVWEIQKRNHLKGTLIVPGQKLLLP